MTCNVYSGTSNPAQSIVRVYSAYFCGYYDDNNHIGNYRIKTYHVWNYYRVGTDAQRVDASRNYER